MMPYCGQSDSRPSRHAEHFPQERPGMHGEARAERDALDAGAQRRDLAGDVAAEDERGS